MLAAAMMLDEVGQSEVAGRIRWGLRLSLADPTTWTRDVAGSANTQQLVDAVIRSSH
jgi:isocitrate dehydrogenase (NAD+)